MLRCARTSEKDEAPAVHAFLADVGAALAPFCGAARGMPSCIIRAEATEALMDAAVGDTSAALAGAEGAGIEAGPFTAAAEEGEWEDTVVAVSALISSIWESRASAPAPVASALLCAWPAPACKTQCPERSRAVCKQKIPPTARALHTHSANSSAWKMRISRANAHFAPAPQPRCCRVKSLVKLIAGVTGASVLLTLASSAALSTRRPHMARGASGWGQTPLPQVRSREAVSGDGAAQAAAQVAKMERRGQRLLKWLQDSGGYVGPVKITAVRRGDLAIRGLVAAREIPANTTILRVPRALILVGDDVDARKYRPSGHGARESDLMLAVRVLQERAKGEASLWSANSSKSALQWVCTFNFRISARAPFLSELLSGRRFWFLSGRRFLLSGRAVFLCLFVISVRAPFLNELPSAQEYAAFHPLMATQADLSRFARLPIVNRIREKKESVKQQFHALGIDREYEWEAFWHAYVTYISRAHGIVITGKRPTIEAKETYYRGKRDLLLEAKETAYRGKRDLL